MDCSGEEEQSRDGEREGLHLPRRACFILGLSIVTVAVLLPFTETWLHPSVHTIPNTGSVAQAAASPRLILSEHLSLPLSLCTWPLSLVSYTHSHALSHPYTHSHSHFLPSVYLSLSHSLCTVHIPQALPSFSLTPSTAQ